MRHHPQFDGVDVRDLFFAFHNSHWPHHLAVVVCLSPKERSRDGNVVLAPRVEYCRDRECTEACFGIVLPIVALRIPKEHQRSGSNGLKQAANRDNRNALRNYIVGEVSGRQLGAESFAEVFACTTTRRTFTPCCCRSNVIPLVRMEVPCRKVNCSFLRRKKKTRV